MRTEIMPLPTFYIGITPIYGKYILAPMDGYTDHPFRLICRQQGSAISVSEFINGIDIANGHPHLESKLKFSDEERPFAYQIFDDNPERMLKAAQFLTRRNPDFIDINMGCSARNVVNRGAGAGLLKDLLKIAKIISSLVTGVNLPITAKIRLGWDDSSKNYLEVSKILEENGASAIFVHARTRKQEYSGIADWDSIGEIKNQVKIPVIGNGDVASIDDADRLIRQTGCDAVMIGRAAIGNPWVFNNSKELEISPESRFEMVKTHLNNMISLYGFTVGVPIFRKHLVRYLSGYLLTPDIRREVFTISDESQLISRIKILMNIDKEFK
jgi:nifR3 family TIM-barrel protein